MLPWMHVYDQQNNSRHLTYCLCTQQKLEVTHPNIYQKFLSGNFSVRRTAGRFNKVASEQLIEQTINKDQKGAGGIICFSTSERTVQRWIVSSHIISPIINDFQTSLGIQDTSQNFKDVLPFRINLDEKRVARRHEIITVWENNFQKSDSFASLSGTTHVGKGIERDLLNAENIEKSS